MMEGGRGGYPHSSGTSWALFEEKAKEYESSMGGWPGSSRNPLSPTSGRLCREDMAIYGKEPALDSLSLVVCRQCGRVVKSQALVKHKDLYHSEVLKIPVPKRISHPHTSVHTIGQPSSDISTETSRLGDYPGGNSDAAVKGYMATDLPMNSGSVGGGKTSKEYDPDRHCGVWVEEEGKRCTRSITCKNHSLSLRRKLPGRSRQFNELLDLHKKRKKLKRLGRQNSEPGLPIPQLSPMSPTASRLPPQQQHIGVPGPLSPAILMDTGGAPGSFSPGLDNWFMDTNTHVEEDEDMECEEGEEEELLPAVASFPTPIAVCSYAHRSTGCGSLVFNRRQDRLRSALARLSGREKNYTETTLHRKHSLHSLLQQKEKRRKYFHKQDSLSLENPSKQYNSTHQNKLFTLALQTTLTPSPSTLALQTTLTPSTLALQTTLTPSPTIPQPPPPLKSPLLSSATESQSFPPPQSFPPSQFYPSVSNTPPETVPAGRDSLIAIPPPAQQKQDKPEKKRSKRGRKPKRAKERNVVEKSVDQSMDNGTVLSWEQQEGGSPEPIRSLAVTEPRQTTTRRAMMTSMLVSVKQEPVTNHDEVPLLEGQNPLLHKNIPKSSHSLILNGMVTPTTPSTILSPSVPFNSLNSSQTFVINPSGQHHPHGHPMLSGILPLGGSMSQSPPSHQRGGFILGQQTPSEQVQFPPSLQPQSMWQQWLAAGNAAAAVVSMNSIHTDSGIPGRAVLLQSTVSHPPIKTSSNSNTPVTGVNSSHSILRPSSHQTSSGRFPTSSPLAVHHLHSSKVRAPISQIPTAYPLQESAPRNLPHGGVHSAINQSNKQTLNQRSHLSSQQVT